MPRKSTGAYPANWKEIAHQVKEAAGWKCVRCGSAHDPKIGYTLTVHHLDLNPANIINGHGSKKVPIGYQQTEWYRHQLRSRFS